MCVSASSDSVTLPTSHEQCTVRSFLATFWRVRSAGNERGKLPGAFVTGFTSNHLFLMSLYSVIILGTRSTDLYPHIILLQYYRRQEYLMNGQEYLLHSRSCRKSGTTVVWRTHKATLWRHIIFRKVIDSSACLTLPFVLTSYCARYLRNCQQVYIQRVLFRF